MRKRTDPRWMLLGVIPLALLVCGCELYSKTEFHPWKGDASFVGSGGVVKDLNGFEYWEYGSPSRPFQVLGVIEQDSRSSILLIDYNREEVVKRLHAIGADGILLIDDERRISGMSISRLGPNYEATINERLHKVLAAFRYLD